MPFGASLKGHLCTAVIAFHVRTFAHTDLRQHFWPACCFFWFCVVVGRVIFVIVLKIKTLHLVEGSSCLA